MKRAALSALDLKLVRDLRRMWAQALAISLVLASGVASLVLSVGAYQSLLETRSAYYERHAFADVFASLTRAPKRLERQIARIDGVLAVETRVSEPAVLDIPGFSPPVTGLVLSRPDHHPMRLNRPYIRKGRPPEPGSSSEVMVDEAFAEAQKLSIGDSFEAILNGRKRRLRITATILSPEFIYAIGPGDLVPDPRRFAILFMSERALNEIFDLDGAFNSVSIKLLPGASEAAVIERLDHLIQPYGGAGAYGREDQLSHAFLDAELEQLRAMARILPPIFLFVSAFLINMTLTRLIALEREQIGLLKALGYDRTSIAFHYVKLVSAIALIGVLIGFGLGTYFGRGLTGIYQEFFNFPFLVFSRDPAIYAIAGLLSLVAAMAGALRSVFKVVALSPATAMQPPAPPRYRQLWSERLGLLKHASQLTMMSLRHIVRWPLRAFLTSLGVALGGALMVVSLFSLDSIERMIDVSFFLTQRQDATLSLSDEQHIRVLEAARRLPGVTRVEPFRSVLVRMRNGPREKKLALHGKPESPLLFRVIDRDLRPVRLPETGIAIDARVAELLKLKRGDLVEIEILGGWRGAERFSEMPFARPVGVRDESQLRSGGAKGRIHAPVTDIIQSYFGLSAFVRLPVLNRMLDEGYIISGIHVNYDPALEDELFDKVKSTPVVASIGLRSVSLAKFRQTLATNIDIMVGIYASLAIIVAFGVVYNSARIQLSEQARELASLRVLGFTRSEVSSVLLLELGILIILAQPMAWGLGYFFSWALVQGFASDLYRVPLVINLSTYAWASLVVLASAFVSVLVVRQRIDQLDMIAVLKTRE